MMSADEYFYPRHGEQGPDETDIEIGNLRDEVVRLKAELEASVLVARTIERVRCAIVVANCIEDWTCPSCDHDTAQGLAAEVDAAIRGEKP